MKIDDLLFHRLEKAARLKVSPEERSRLQADIDRILDYVELLNEVDVSDLEPMVRPVDLVNQTREDVVAARPFPRKILENAYEEQDGYFVVPKIL